jgi:serine/threonine-protein phosphatase 2B catalytic subunit
VLSPSLVSGVLIFKETEPNLVKVQEPIVMVGDLHGQYYDLNHMLEKAGHPPNINYLFLGDYVDRGIFGFEVTLLLFAIKVR